MQESGGEEVMKNNFLSPWPRLTDEILTMVSVQSCPFVFSSSSGRNPEAEGSSWPGPVTFGHRGEWSFDEHDLDLSITFRFQNLQCLFSDEGIAYSGATLALGLEWRAPESDQRGLSSRVTFTREDNELDASFRLHFDPAQILGKVQLDIMLFLAVPDPSPDMNCGFRANVAGMVLGKMQKDTGVLDMEGNGTLFPVEEICGNRDEPLWKLRYDSGNASSDTFSERNVALVINSASPDYSLWKEETGGGAGFGPFSRSVVSSWLTLFLLSLKESDPDVYDLLGTDSDNDFEQGSIAHAANYFVESFGINRESVASIAASFQREVTRKMHDDGDRK